jgi:hypothetical protein
MRISEEDFAELEEQSLRTGVSKSEIIRRAWKNLHVAEMPSGDFLAMARELRRIGTNLNQFVKIANVRSAIDAPKVREALDDVINIDRKIRQMIGGENV